VIQIMQPDINQEIYGVPEYLSALQSALLNEAATLFRRRYYLNGSHAGYILYATGDIDENDTDELRDALKNSKGPGNFKNLFVHAPGGKEGSIKILPIAEVGAKDEFLGIKNATRDDVLAAHRTPPSVLGIVPAQGSQLGKISEAVDMFFELEILPLQMAFMEINDRLGVEAVRFTSGIAGRGMPGCNPANRRGSVSPRPSANQPSRTPAICGGGISTRRGNPTCTLSIPFGPSHLRPATLAASATWPHAWSR
jgi:hypothetical protein